ncbi:MAG: ACT domain-containing protein [Verrucomicrobia bacterium]|nr:ACT domain-containing protein [Verrucomicrobiota bacterium]
MEAVTQLALFLANRPGTLAAVCDALATEEINIFALTISDTVDHSVVRMVVSDPKKALSIFEEHGTLVVESDVIMLEHDNRPGTLSGIAKKLAAQGVNIEYAYLAGAPGSNRSLLILRPNDLKKAIDVLS